MSKLTNPEVAELADLLEAQVERLRGEHDVWSDIQDERLTAVMDKKPELRDGVEFIDKDIIIPPLLVEPFFPSGGLALLHGKRGLGKTMLAMGLAHSVCTGDPFLGLFPARRGTVVYMQIDMTDNVFQDRLRAAGGRYRLPDMHILTGVASIQRARENTSWVLAVNALQPDLIIIDTLRKAHSMNENDSDSAGRFYGKLRELFGWTSVVLVHHDRKSSESTTSFTEESFRGSGAWIDDVDVGLHLKKSGRGMELSFSKVRVCEDIDPIKVEIDPKYMCLVRSVTAGLPVVGKRVGATALDVARQFRESNPDADVDDTYSNLLDAGFSKAAASKKSRYVHGKLAKHDSL